MSGRASSSRVQSLQRAFGVIEAVSAAGGCLAIRAVADATELPQPTVHRLLQTLVELGYMRQLPDRRYALGFRFVPLGAAAHQLVGARAEPVLAHLVRELGETANLAIMAGDRAVYVAQSPSSHSVRMFTEIGRCVDLHSTGVGKALLAQLTDDDVEAIVRRTGLASHTPHTIVSTDHLHAVLVETRERGYALDREEQETGVCCVAAAVPTLLGTAVSVSGPLARMNDAMLARAVPLLQAAAQRLVDN